MRCSREGLRRVQGYLTDRTTLSALTTLQGNGSGAEAGMSSSLGLGWRAVGDCSAHGRELERKRRRPGSRWRDAAAVDLERESTWAPPQGGNDGRGRDFGRWRGRDNLGLGGTTWEG